MAEEQKNLLKEKLKLFFDNKLETLTNKFESDINLIEQLKLNVYDNIIIPYREMNKLVDNNKARFEKEFEEKREKERKKLEEKEKQLLAVRLKAQEKQLEKEEAEQVELQDLRLEAQNKEDKREINDQEIQKIFMAFEKVRKINQKKINNFITKNEYVDIMHMNKNENENGDYNNNNKEN